MKQIVKRQLDLWGIDYFDLFLVHFPISLQYVDPDHRYPPEWFGDDGKVHLRGYHFFHFFLYSSSLSKTENTPLSETWGALEELVDEGLAKNIGLRYAIGSPGVAVRLTMIQQLPGIYHP